MSSELKVTAADLNKLAGSQHDVATHITTAEAATDGATAKVALTHGLACSLTVAALGAAQSSRSTASQAMANASNVLAGKLNTAAADYSRTDQQEQHASDGQIRAH